MLTLPYLANQLTMYSIPLSFPFLGGALFTWGSSSLGRPLCRDSASMSAISKAAMTPVCGQCMGRSRASLTRPRPAPTTATQQWEIWTKVSFHMSNVKYIIMKSVSV